jgi:signal transduction histidine kinase
MTAWGRAHRLPLGAEIALAFATGAGTFALAALALDRIDTGGHVAVLGVVYLAGVVAIARFAGIAYAVPAGMAGMLAYDWFHLAPTHPFEFPDSANLVDLIAYLLVAVLLGELAAHTTRRAQAAERARGEVADEQAALRRVATLVARTAPADELFAAVAAEAGRLFDVHGIRIARYEDHTELVHVAEWSTPGHDPPAYDRAELEGTSVSAEVLRTGRAARIDNYEDVAVRAAFARGIDVKSVVGAPIVIDERPWGVMIAWSASGSLPGEMERRLSHFAELVATAISNADARMGMARLVTEQAALRRVATLVARAVPTGEVFAAVTREVGLLCDADLARMERCEPDGTVTAVGDWSATGHKGGAGNGPADVAALVHRTGRPARIDDDDGKAPAPVPDSDHGQGTRATVGVPISVGGRLWGVMTVSTTRAEPLPADTEARLAGFTELVATAIGNAEAQAALAASRARIVATADTTRRRFERDLHDGVQQRLVSLALNLRGPVRAAVPPEADKLTAQLDGIAAEIGGVLEELRELARGLHPAALADGGLRPALKTLARRSAVPVRLDVRLDRRLPEPVELAAYYAVAEALTNAAKHAQATAVDVDVQAGEDVLHVLVRDDGRGGADPAGGSGLVGLTDRVEALGGRFSLQSPPGAGTTVHIALSLADPGR